jgi:glycosyltransferase involved in cell wall biosynthesis
LKTNLGRKLDKVGSAVVKYLSLPDHMVYWVPFAYAKARRLLNEKSHRIVYTTSPPHSEHLVGFLLKRRYRTIWIADLRDPIMDNVSAKNFGFAENIINAKLEKLIVKNADAVITNSYSAQRCIEKKYNARTVTTIYNAYDEEDFDSIKIDKFGYYTIAHVGSIYGNRKVDILFESIKELHINGMISPNKFKVLFTGINDYSLRKAIQIYGIEDYIEIRESVPHFEALKLMRRAHLLLLVKNYGDNSANHIPGKLFEYIGSGNKILYIGPDNNEVVDIIKSHKLGCIIDGSQKDLSKFILNELAVVNSIDSVEKNKEERFFHEFSSQTMAKQFDQVMTKVLNQ